MNVSQNNKRIAKNTLLLYFRMLLIMIVNLFTSRVVLNTLGIEDYGIYNIVGGVVSMFGFINAAMSTSTQRYLTFELGKENFLRLRDVFSTCVNIHVLISVVIVFLAETIGLFFFYYKMIIPIERMDAAFWVYQFSVLSTVVAIMSVPYNAVIIAHEKMSAFAYISVMETVLKLLIVYLLLISNTDRLVLYALLIFVVQLLVRLVYGIYCYHHFAESKYKWSWKGKLFKEIVIFSGWNLWGNCAAIAFTQGLNVLLNVFFGPVVNAARGIAVQVQGAVTQFSSNFQMALNPQIIKSYAANDLESMHNLVFRSSKFTFYLLLFFSLPVMIETKSILYLWLGIIPDYTVSFLRLMLCTGIIDSVAGSLMVSVVATGKVRLYQSVIGGILLLILPVSYIVLELGGNPVSVFWVHLCICLVAFIVRLFIIRPLIKLSLTVYVRKVIIRCFGVGCIASFFPLLTYIVLSNTLLSSLFVCLMSIISTLVTSYLIGMDKVERLFVRDKIVTLCHKYKR